MLQCTIRTYSQTLNLLYLFMATLWRLSAPNIKLSGNTVQIARAPSKKQGAAAGLFGSLARFFVDQFYLVLRFSRKRLRPWVSWFSKTHQSHQRKLGFLTVGNSFEAGLHEAAEAVRWVLLPALFMAFFSVKCRSRLA